MKCFRFSLTSNDGANGLYRVNSQGNHELTKLLNEQNKYKIVLRKFLILGTEFDTTNEINQYYVTLSFKNVNFINSFNSESNDNILVRTVGNLQELSSGKYLLTCDEFFNVMENNAGIYSSDRTIEQGNLNIEIVYLNPLNGSIIQPNSQLWTLEFYIIFD